MKFLRALMVIATFATVVGTGASAYAGTPAIVGTVTDASGAGIGQICVSVVDENGWYYTETRTGDSGNYAFDQIDDGSYRIHFQDCNEQTRYASEWFDNKPTFQTANIVVISSAGDTVGVDAELTLGGVISGTLTDDVSGAPIADACVQAFDHNGDQGTSVGSGYSDSAGAYRVGGLPAGAFDVQFGPCSYAIFIPRVQAATPLHAVDASRYIPEWYDNQRDQNAASPVAVLEGLDTKDINAALTLGGSIVGSVTNEQGDGIFACVDATLDGWYVGATQAEWDGSYRIDGLEAGNYKVRFYDCSDYKYQEEWFDNVRTRTRATLIPVTLGVESTGIDAELALRPRPNLAVTALEVSPVPLRTDLGTLPAGTGMLRDVSVDLSNLGTASADYATLNVWATSESDKTTQRIAEDSLSALAPGKSLRRTFRWNATETVGDVTVHALVCSQDDPNRNDDEMAVQHYSIVGGTGFGVRAAPNQYVSYCWKYDF